MPDWIDKEHNRSSKDNENFDEMIDSMLPNTIEECKKKQGMLLESHRKVRAGEVRAWGFTLPANIPNCATAKIKRLRILGIREDVVEIRYWFGHFEWLSCGLLR